MVHHRIVIERFTVGSSVWPPAPPQQSVPGAAEPGVPSHGSSTSRTPTAKRLKLLLPTPDLSPIPLSVSEARDRPSRLLEPQHLIVPFTGRQEPLDGLAGWMAGDRPAFRLIHGPAGQGKTRLVRQVATRCSLAGWVVWQAGHPRSPSTGRAELDGAVLVIVDDADRWPVAVLLDTLGAAYRLWLRDGATVRVLLTARAAGHWWRAVAAAAALGGWGGAVTDEVALAPLEKEPGIDRAGLLGAAAEWFAAALGVEVPEQLPALTGPDFATVLAVHMAALAAVHAHDRGRTPPRQPADICAYLLGHEQDHLRRRAGMTGMDMRSSTESLRRLTVTATLAGPLPLGAARQALTAVDLAHSEPAADRLLAAHGASYPPADAELVLEPPHPGRLGEDLVALMLSGDRGLAIRAAADDQHGRPEATGQDDGGGSDPVVATSSWAAGVLTALLVSAHAEPYRWSATALRVLVEAAHRWPHVRDALSELLCARPELLLGVGGGTLDRLASIPGLDTGVLVAAEPLLPRELHADRHGYRHLDLDIGAAAIGTELARRRLIDMTDTADRAAQARRLSGQLADALDSEQALVWARTAVDGYRRCGTIDQRGLATALLNLHLRLSWRGQPEEALTAGRQVLAAYQGLSLPDSEDQARLATTVDGLADQLAQLGRLDEAAAMAEEAVGLYRPLAAADPDTFGLRLADELRNWSLWSSAQPSARLSAAEESVTILRPMADADPDVHVDLLARSLVHHHDLLAAAGHHNEALASAREAVAAFERLAHTSRGHRYQAAQAGALWRLAKQLARQDGPAAAARVLRRSIRLLRQCCRVESDTYWLQLAGALSDLADQVAAELSPAGGLAHREEAVRLCRQLVRTDRDAHLPHLAHALTNLRDDLWSVDRCSESMEASQEAWNIYRLLLSDGRDGYLFDFALETRSLAMRLLDEERPTRALDLTDDAVSVFRRLSPDVPAAQRDIALADTLTITAMCLSDRGEPQRALAAVDESIGLLRSVPEELKKQAGILLDNAHKLRSRLSGGVPSKL